jgi:AbrB family looped-hinge helix DNA binding protein
MAKKDKSKMHPAPEDRRVGCCHVESVISVDERGQTVLPKEMREKANIRAGDKLAAMSWEKDGKVCCITLIKVEEFSGMVKDLLGPMMKEMYKK